MKIRDNMSAVVLTVGPDHTLREAAQLMSERNIGAALVGLGRSIFGVLEHSLIAHGLEKIQQRLACGEARPIANFVTATPGGQLVRAQMAPVLQRERETADETDETDATIGGYVLILDDITRRVDLESQRDQLLQSLTEGARAALGNIRAAIENLSEFPDMEAPQRDRFIGIVREEAQAMSARLDRTVSQYSDALKVRWPRCWPNGPGSSRSCC